GLPAGSCGRRCAKGPKGMEAAAFVATTQAVEHPSCSASRRASSARWVLPTPAGPESTAPPRPARMASATRVRSDPRPTNGHSKLRPVELVERLAVVYRPAVRGADQCSHAPV